METKYHSLYKNGRHYQTKGTFVKDMATTCCVQLSKRGKYLEKLASSLVVFSYILPFEKNNAYHTTVKGLLLFNRNKFYFFMYLMAMAIVSLCVTAPD